MKWVSHTVIGGSIAAAINPIAVPMAIAGSTAPDWLESVARAGGARVVHREQTHYLLYWLVLFVVALAGIDWNGQLAAFAGGAFLHVLCDSLTVSGVPFSPASSRRFHLLGGRLVTGSVHEYAIAGAVFLLSAFIINGGNSSTYKPYFYEWWSYYDQGIIDASEWKANRFKVF